MKKSKLQNNKIASSRSTIFHFFLLLAIPLSVCFFWFHNGTLLAGGEEGILFYNPLKLINLSSSIWIDVSTGGPTTAFLPQLPLIDLFYLYTFLDIPAFLFQSALYYFLMVTALTSMYFLVLLFVTDYEKKRLVAIVASIFYLLNPYTMLQIWERGLTPQYFLFASLPLFLVLFAIGLKTRSYMLSLCIALTSFLFSMQFSLMTNIIVVWSVLVLYWLYFVYTHPKKEFIFFSIRFFVFTFLLWLATSSWWLLPLFTSLGNTAQTSGIDPKANVDSLIGVSQYFPFRTLIRLGQDFYYSSTGIYGKTYSRISFQTISWLLPLMLLIGISAVKKVKEMKFFILLFFVGLFISLGSNPPFGGIFLWLFSHIIILQAFRNPYEKFGIVYLLGYTPFFALGLIYLAQFINRYFKSIHVWVTTFFVLLLISGYYVKPMIDHVATKGVSIPQYYTVLRNWLERNDSDGHRVMMTPLVGEGIRQQWGQTIYSGVDPATYLLEHSVISNDLGINYTTELLANIKNHKDTMDVSPYFAMFATKYLIVRNDALDVQQEGDKYFFKYIYRPTEGSVNETVCDKQHTTDHRGNAVRLLCSFGTKGKDMHDVKFLKINIQTDQPAKLVFDVYDDRGVKISWDGLNDAAYSSKNTDMTTFILNIHNATQFYDYFNLSDISNIEIFAYPDGRGSQPSQIYLGKIGLDFGEKTQISSYTFVKTFGKLELYKPSAASPAPILGLMNAVKSVEGFSQLFNNKEVKRTKFDKEAFILKIQNKQKNTGILERISSAKVLDKEKISDSKYWLKTSANDNKYILLSETFHPQWKVIPGVSKKEIENNFFGSISLVKKIYLPEKYHYVADGYANLWKVNGNEKEYAIVFLPQLYADIGAWISKIIFSLIIIFIVFKKLLTLKK